MTCQSAGNCDTPSARAGAPPQNPQLSTTTQQQVTGPPWSHTNRIHHHHQHTTRLCMPLHVPTLHTKTQLHADTLALNSLICCVARDPEKCPVDSIGAPYYDQLVPNEPRGTFQLHPTYQQANKASTGRAHKSAILIHLPGPHLSTAVATLDARQQHTRHCTRKTGIANRYCSTTTTATARSLPHGRHSAQDCAVASTHERMNTVSA